MNNEIQDDALDDDVLGNDVQPESTVAVARGTPGAMECVFFKALDFNEAVPVELTDDGATPAEFTADLDLPESDIGKVMTFRFDRGDDSTYVVARLDAVDGDQIVINSERSATCRDCKK